MGRGIPAHFGLRTEAFSKKNAMVSVAIVIRIFQDTGCEHPVIYRKKVRSLGYFLWQPPGRGS